MPRKFKQKDTPFKGLLNPSGDSQVSSFEGRINGGLLKHYIKVNVEGEWLTLAQARRLVRIIQDHINRVEGAQGADITTGNKRYKKSAAPSTATFVGYTEAQTDRFLADVERLAKKHFLHWENDYKWKIVEGQKTELTMNFQTWMSVLRARISKK